jgi:hypothetical protein
MNALALPYAERVRLLRALGVQPLVLRRVAQAAQQQAQQPAATPAPILGVATLTDKLALIVLLPAGAAADARQQALLRAALLCLPNALQRAPCVEFSTLDGALPAAAAYLVLGSEARAALGRLLPLDAQASALIEHADAPAEMLAQPARKRALWRALKALRGRHARSA